MIKKVMTSTLLGLILLVGVFSSNVNTAEASGSYKYTWPFKEQQVTVNLDTNYSITGHELYRGITNKVGITMNYKVSAKTGLTVASVSHYKYGIMWPVQVTDLKKSITKSSAKVGETATAYATYTGKITGWNGKIDLLTEYPRTDGNLKLVSIDTKKKTAVVKFTGALKH